MTELEQELRKAVEKTLESEIMRALVTLYFSKPDMLTKRGLSLASMGVKRLVDAGYNLEKFMGRLTV